VRATGRNIGEIHNHHMRTHFLSAVALSAFALASISDAAQLESKKDADPDREIDLRGRVVRPYDPSDPSDNYSRIIQEQKRRAVEDGREVIITRRLYEEPNGDILVQETRDPVER